MEILLKEYGIRVAISEDMTFKEFENVCLTNNILTNTDKDFRTKYLKKYYDKNKPVKKNDNNRTGGEPKKSKSNKDL